MNILKNAIQKKLEKMTSNQNSHSTPLKSKAKKEKTKNQELDQDSLIH